MKRRFGHSSIFCHSSEKLVFTLLIYLALYFRSRLTHILWFCFVLFRFFLFGKLSSPTCHSKQRNVRSLFLGGAALWFWVFGFFYFADFGKDKWIRKERFFYYIFIRIFTLFAIYYLFYHILIIAHMCSFAYIFLPTLFPMAYEFINSTHRSRAGHSLKFLIPWKTDRFRDVHYPNWFIYLSGKHLSAELEPPCSLAI